jgi:hypothetical protein
MTTEMRVMTKNKTHQHQLLVLWSNPQNLFRETPPGFPVFPNPVLKPLFSNKEKDKKGRQAKPNEQRAMQLLERLGPQKLITEYEGVVVSVCDEMLGEEDPSDCIGMPKTTLRVLLSSNITRQLQIFGQTPDKNTNSPSLWCCDVVESNFVCLHKCVDGVFLVNGDGSFGSVASDPHPEVIIVWCS